MKRSTHLLLSIILFSGIQNAMECDSEHHDEMFPNTETLMATNKTQPIDPALPKCDGYYLGVPEICSLTRSIATPPGELPKYCKLIWKIMYADAEEPAPPPTPITFAPIALPLAESLTQLLPREKSPERYLIRRQPLEFIQVSEGTCQELMKQKDRSTERSRMWREERKAAKKAKTENKKN
jgi:hypothetical protein